MKTHNSTPCSTLLASPGDVAAGIHFLQSQRSRSVASVACSWKLTAGHAISLRPRQSGVLRIAQGQAWATLGVAPRGHANQSGDHILHCGQGLVVQAGQHLVVEALGWGGEAAMHFEWAPLDQIIHAHAHGGARVVTQPWADLYEAAGMAGGALLRLCTGLLTYGRQRLTGRTSAVVN